MKKLIVSTFLLFSFFSEAQTQDVHYFNTQSNSQESDNIAKVETVEDGINFDEWESDFNKSITKTPKNCKGQNCQFKNKQALDPSFDF